jgi:hypothetical protein
MPKTFDKAATERSATATRVAAQVRNSPAPASSSPAAPRPRAAGSVALERVSMNLPSDVLRSIDRTLYEIRDRSGHKVSSSAFIEIALRELLARPDVEEILVRHGAKARRATPKASA